jgi:hypothetical protein
MLRDAAAQLADALMRELSLKTLASFDSCLLHIYDEAAARQRIVKILFDADGDQPRTLPQKPEERSPRKPENRPGGRSTVRVEVSPRVTPKAPVVPPKEKAWDRRRHERIPVQSQVVICWEDRQGQQRMKARAVNASPSGVLLEVEKPVAVGTTVILQTSSFAVLGKASVRHCESNGSRYTIGLYVAERLPRTF